MSVDRLPTPGDGTAIESEISAEIRRFIAEETLGGEPDEPIDDDYPLVDNGVLDSLELATLISRLQERFQVDISPADMTPADFRTARTICALVQGSLMKRAASA